MSRVNSDLIAAFVCEEFAIKPPVDLAALSKAIGVRSIRRMEMVEAGRVSWERGQPVIYLRANQVHISRRFIWAHEIAHVILRSDLVPDAHRAIPTDLDHDELEQACDLLAAAILMPRAWIREQPIAHSFNLANVMQVADACDVSITSALIRTKALFRSNSAIISFQRKNRRFDTRGLGLAPGWRLTGLREIEPTSGVAHFVVHDRSYDVPVELAAGARTQLMMLPYVPWAGRSRVPVSGRRPPEHRSPGWRQPATAPVTVCHSRP